VENRFLEMERDFGGLSARNGHHAGTRTLSTRSFAERSFSWERPMSAAQRVLLILLENGGVELGIPDLADKILSVVPASLVSDDTRRQLVELIRAKIRGFTDNLLETAELAANRYTAAKPDSYSDVVVLRDATAVYSELKSQLIALSQAGKIIDVFILTHGGENVICLAGSVTGENIRQIKAEYGKPLSIRAVYMMNCYGSTLNQAWLDAGAKVSSGSKLINYLPEPTMFFFWQNWKEGQTFESAATSAYKSTVQAMNDAVRNFLIGLPVPGTSLLAGSFDFSSFDFVQQSAPVIQGQGSLTISTDDISFSQSTSGAMATTVVPVRHLLRALSGSDAGPAVSSPMSVSAAGVEFVKGWEGFFGKLYNDAADHCTVGYGTLVHAGKCDGRHSEQPYVNGVSKDKATQLLANELADTQKIVSAAVKVKLNQNENDALVSFAFNVGVGSFKKSTLLTELNKDNRDAVPGELKKWTKVTRGGKKVDVQGLVDRRAAEATLFRTPVTAATQSVSRLGSFGRALSERGANIPVRDSYRYHSPSPVVTAQSNFAYQQNPAIAGIAIADAIQIGLAGVAMVQAQLSSSQGSFYLAYDKTQRLLTSEARAAMPGSQMAKKSYRRSLLWIGELKEGFADASVIIEWEGNPYGEMSTVVIRRDLQNSTDWTRSSNNTTISKLDRIPLPNTDPRTWPIVYTYEGTFDPIGNGHYEYSGEFEINAFGGLKFTRHEVVSRSLMDWAKMGEPEEYVKMGRDIIVPVPDVPKEQLDYLRTKLP
jgi:GH24 family phage-related lysozyme (muramidase)